MEHSAVCKPVSAVPESKPSRFRVGSNNCFEQKGVPCTEYQYGVKVTVDDQESEIV